jgi:hypothetical protein
MKNKTIACCAALLLCACSSAPVRPPAAICPPAAVVATAPGQAVGQLLAFQASTRLLKPAELARLLAEPDGQGGTAGATLRRAMLLAAQRGSGDLARAQALLEAIDPPPTPDGRALRALAQFLGAAYGDARRQEEAQDKLALKLREAQRHIEQLDEKVEALKNIERALSARASTPAPAQK